MHELAGLNHAAAGGVVDRAAMRAGIGVVIVDDCDDGKLETRHVPQRRRTGDERTVADEADDLLVWARELDACRGPDAGAQVRSIVEEQFAPAERVELEAVESDRAQIGRASCR